MSDLAPTLVTGATGFVGSAVARALLARATGCACWCARAATAPTSPGCRRSWRWATCGTRLRSRAPSPGCRHVVHVAADYRLWVPDPDGDEPGQRRRHPRPAAGGARRRAWHAWCIAAAWPRSAWWVTARWRTRPRRTRWRRWSAPTSAPNTWPSRPCWRWRATGVPVVVVNPSAPVGPRDIKPTPTGKMIADTAAGRMPAYVDTGLNVVHVDDVAEGHCLALERGRVGECYILGGEDMVLGDLLALVAEVAGRKPPRVKLPNRRAVSAGAGERGAGAGGRHRADRHPRHPGDGAQEDVLLLRQGPRRTRLRPPARRARRWPTRSPGSAPPAGCRHDGAGPAGAGRLGLPAGGAWPVLVRRAEPFRLPAPRAPDRWTSWCRRATRRRASNAACARCWRRTIRARCASCWWMTAAATAPATSRAAWPATGCAWCLDARRRPAGLERQAVGRGRRAWRRADAPLVLLCDADIVHDPAHAATLVAKLEHRAGPGVRDGGAELRERGRAGAGAGLRVLLPAALPVRARPTTRTAAPPRPPAAPCWSAARRWSASAGSRRCAAR